MQSEFIRLESVEPVFGTPGDIVWVRRSDITMVQHGVIAGTDGNRNTASVFVKGRSGSITILVPEGEGQFPSCLNRASEPLETYRSSNPNIGG
ncbi:hypothetical protein CYG48_05005 [Neorhizobium sp. SOG26]|uniref:hypothetical protein n=1 Tax=Neorhizobium sp. SOG26 TaxID=2060726 RepID=UPI000E56E56D|nr:hypothetical protein [Neorhizobium sp. SOG26]AXV15115.1 hypothetical protein CYG48_05005 [Neorhizobium sp. SOG26]